MLLLLSRGKEMTTEMIKKIKEYKGIYTANRVNSILDNLTGGDAHVEQAFDKNSKTGNHWYVCIDTYRPGKEYKGKTPKLAAQKAGFTVI